MILIALLVPVILLLVMFALDALENFLFPPPEKPVLREETIPEQATSE
ncbi:hypothetical protein ACWGQ5_36515 [Streptomyces sp. NPDC055722]